MRCIGEVGRDVVLSVCVVDRRRGGGWVVGIDGAWWKARVRCGVIGVADGDGSGVRGGGRSVVGGT